MTIFRRAAVFKSLEATTNFCPDFLLDFAPGGRQFALLAVDEFARSVPKAIELP